MCLWTPVKSSGPSTTTRFWETMSTTAHILPAHGPYVIKAKRPGSTKRVNMGILEKEEEEREK